MTHRKISTTPQVAEDAAMIIDIVDDSGSAATSATRASSVRVPPRKSAESGSSSSAEDFLADNEIDSGAPSSSTGKKPREKVAVLGKELKDVEKMMKAIYKFKGFEGLTLKLLEGVVQEKFKTMDYFFIVLDFGYRILKESVLKWQLDGLPKGSRTFRGATTLLKHQGMKRGGSTLAIVVRYKPAEPFVLASTGSFEIIGTKDTLIRVPFTKDDDEGNANQSRQDDEDDDDDDDDEQEEDGGKGKRRRPRGEGKRAAYMKVYNILPEITNPTDWTVTSLTEGVRQPYHHNYIVPCYKNRALSKDRAESDFRLAGPNGVSIDFVGYFAERRVHAWRIRVHPSNGHEDDGFYVVTGLEDGRHPIIKEKAGKSKKSKVDPVQYHEPSAEEELIVDFPPTPPPILQPPPLPVPMAAPQDDEQMPEQLPRWFAQFVLTGNPEAERKAIEQLMDDPALRTKALVELKTSWSAEVHRQVEAASKRDDWQLQYQQEQRAEIRRRAAQDLLAESDAARKRAEERLRVYEEQEMAKINIRLDSEARQKVILEYEQSLARTKIQQMQTARTLARGPQPAPPPVQKPYVPQLTEAEKAFLSKDL